MKLDFRVSLFRKEGMTARSLVRLGVDGRHFSNRFEERRRSGNVRALGAKIQAQAKDVELETRGRTIEIGICFARILIGRAGHISKSWVNVGPTSGPSPEKLSGGGHIDTARFTSGRMAEQKLPPAATIFV